MAIIFAVATEAGNRCVLVSLGLVTIGALHTLMLAYQREPRFVVIEEHSNLEARLVVAGLAGGTQLRAMCIILFMAGSARGRELDLFCGCLVAAFAFCGAVFAA